MSAARALGSRVIRTLLAVSALAGPAAAMSVSDQLRHRLESAGEPSAVVVAGEPIRAAVALPRFYAERIYQPAWVRDGAPSAEAAQLIRSLESASRDGLEPSHYHLGAIKGLVSRREGVTAQERDRVLASLDLLLTDALLTYGAHLVSGQLDPATFDPEWLAVRREVDLLATLERALSSGRVQDELEGLLPNHSGYFRLRRALADYRKLAERGGWRPIVAAPALRIGETDERLTAALNVSLESRVRQLEINLERWRWLPQSLGSRHVLVNLPAFDLRLVEDEEVVLTMRVVVGRPYRRTPVFSDAIRYMVFNPYWEIPARVAVQDKLPDIRRDPEFLSRQKIRVFQGWGAGQSELDPGAIDWASLGPGRFPYRLRQDPGPLNALGRVKFMFPNRFNVYLHDTPSREVFRRAERDVSSGCIRLERPLDLAEELLRSTPGWDRERIQRVLAGWQETTVPLASQVPVHLLHWSAWVEPDGTVHFRSDLYGRDDRLSAALASLAEDDRR